MVCGLKQSYKSHHHTSMAAVDHRRPTCKHIHRGKESLQTAIVYRGRGEMNDVKVGGFVNRWHHHR